MLNESLMSLIAICVLMMRQKLITSSYLFNVAGIIHDFQKSLAHQGCKIKKTKFDNSKEPFFFLCRLNMQKRYRWEKQHQVAN